MNAPQSLRTDVYLLREVVRALARINGPESREVLRRATRDPSRRVAAAARYERSMLGDS
jgi:phage FluMu protein gp41